jgi:hypothetical protein
MVAGRLKGPDRNQGLQNDADLDVLVHVDGLKT